MSVDLDLLNAKLMMLGHTHVCNTCGWTGKYGEVKRRRVGILGEGYQRVQAPVGDCPDCGATYKLTDFRVVGEMTAKEQNDRVVMTMARNRGLIINPIP